MIARARLPVTLLLLAELCAPGRALAQPAVPDEAAPPLPPVLTLRSALEIFRKRGFDLLVAEASVRSAEGDLTIAGAVPNPGLSSSAGKNFFCSATQDCTVVSFSVGLTDNNAISDLVTGKRGLRKDVAAAALSAARRSRDDAQRTLEFQVKQAYTQVLLQDALVQAAKETKDSNGHTRDLNERKFSFGAINEGDLAKSQVAALEAEQAVDQAGQNLRAAKVALAFLLGYRTLVPDFEVAAHELDYEVPPALEGAARQLLLDDALRNRPDLRAQLQQTKRADSAVALAHRNRVPDFALSATYSANGFGETNISPPNVSIGLSVPLPLFYHQRGEISKAEADLSTQHALLHKAEAQVVSDVETAYAQLDGARKLVQRMQPTLLERARKARDIVQVQYEKGAATLLDLLDAQRTYTSTRVEYAQDLAGYWNAVAALEQATGKELRP
jgi:cobalt-zinc-cadmium efflux system outer membrane protein